MVEDIQPAQFSAPDYVVFGAMLLASTAIGIYYAWKDRNEKDVEAYLVGKGQMSPIPVAISLCVSYVSGIMMVGLPAQVYYFGGVLVWCSAAFFVGPWITATYYIPLYFRLDIMSVYEILEMRFGKVSRILASTSILVLMLMYMGMVTFIPCLSLSAVSNTSMTLSIFLTCTVCTFYTTLGGIKAVIWTDVLQAAIMVLGMISVIVKTTLHLGGVSNVTAALSRGGRLDIFEFSFDPYLRYSVWTIIFGLSIIWTMMASINQPMVQRYLSCKNVTQAKVSAWLLVIPQQIFFWLAFIMGLVMYAYYEGCDPLESGQIEMPDQGVPYMVVSIFQDIPGLSGVFIAAVYSGTLSTISSGINALSGIILSDIILKAKPELAKKSLLISKSLGVLLGMAVLGVTFVIQLMGTMVVDLLFAAFGGIGGPLLGVFTLGLFVPWISEKGAVTGQIIGSTVSFWITIGQLVYPPPADRIGQKNSYVDQCPSSLYGNGSADGLFNVQNNSTNIWPTWETTTTSFETTTEAYRPKIADTFYALSSNYIGVIGFLITIALGVIVSGITGFEKPENANPELFMPFVDNKCLPKGVIKWFRLGVPPRRVPDGDESSSIMNEKLLDEEKTSEMKANSPSFSELDEDQTLTSLV